MRREGLLLCMVCNTTYPMDAPMNGMQVGLPKGYEGAEQDAFLQFCSYEKLTKMMAVFFFGIVYWESYRHESAVNCMIFIKLFVSQIVCDYTRHIPPYD